jgi:glyoxylase-like metal-dependent hydrolase (beta-lactamase superfamily II)
MLYCAEEKLFLVADQVIAKISPNVSVWAVDPDGDPLGLYLRSLASLKTEIDANSLVLAGHQLPFYGLASRAGELIEHHERRCQAIAEACRIAPKSAAELIPVLFSHRSLDPHQMSFAFSEVLAHVNFMLRRGTASWVDQNADVLRLTA